MDLKKLCDKYGLSMVKKTKHIQLTKDGVVVATVTSTRPGNQSRLRVVEADIRRSLRSKGAVPPSRRRNYQHTQNNCE